MKLFTHWRWIWKSDEEEEEEEEEEEDFTYENNSDSSEDHGTEYQDHVNRYWREEDGSDYDYGSGYESFNKLKIRYVFEWCFISCFVFFS